MAPLELEGITLGDKHRNYNKLLKEALDNGSLDNIVKDCAGDIINLLKIDFANGRKDVKAILMAFQSTDLLYSSHAIKRCAWLIEDEKYAHIINPKYIYMELMPLMTKKAFNKLILRVRLTLKNEKRVEEFYKYEINQDKERAFKWLEHCSLPIILNAVKEFRNKIPKNILKRLFRRSFTVFETYVKENDDARLVKHTRFLLKGETEKYLNIVKSQNYFARPCFTAKNTKLIMKISPHMILENVRDFSDQIHIPTFAKYIKQEQVSTFLTDYAKVSKGSITYNILKYFVKYVSYTDKFKILKTIFIDQETRERNLNNVFLSDTVVAAYTENNIDTYQWYSFAPFDVAFVDLTQLIKAESSPTDRVNMLCILIHCSKQDYQNIKTLLQYFKEKHINEPYVFKAHFLGTLLTKTNPHRYDEETWNILNQLFFSIDVYVESNRDVQRYIEHIIIYNSIHKIDIPKIIERKFIFNTLKLYQRKLDNFEKNKVFEYLFGYLTKRLETRRIKNENDFKTTLNDLRNTFSLLSDWNKEFVEYPQVRGKLKELLVMKEENDWDAEFSEFYKLNKSWRRSMFEESIILNPSVNVCINALKHDVKLLQRYDSKVEELRFNDAVSLQKVLSKLRIYWPQTLAVNWKNAYFKRIDHDPKHSYKSLIDGLIALLETEQLRPIIIKYAPEQAKINWNEQDLNLLSIRKYVASKLHLARPPLPLDDILLYAKGDYLQHTVPAIVSTLDNLSLVQSKIDLMKIINGPVSLQKLGIRFALLKINPDELTTLFMNIWDSTKNLSIRTVLFTTTFQMLCKEKNTSTGQSIFKLLCTFIDNLTTQEDKLIYKKLSDIKNVPSFAKGIFYEKSYFFLKSLPPNHKNIFKRLINNTVDIIEFLNPVFVENELFKEICDTFHLQYCAEHEIVASYLLYSNDEKAQQAKYDNILYPLLKHHLKSWNDRHNGQHYVKMNFNKLFLCLLTFVWNTIDLENVIVPDKLFSQITTVISTAPEIPVEESFRLITLLKLVAAMMRALNDNITSKPKKDRETSIKQCSKKITGYRTYGYQTKIWSNYFVSCIPIFVKDWIEYLKQDIEKYDTSVFELYKQVLTDLFEDKFNISNLNIMDIVKYFMLESNNHIESYLLSIYLCPEDLYDADHKTKFEELETIILAHSSPIVRMHFYGKYPDRFLNKN